MSTKNPPLPDLLSSLTNSLTSSLSSLPAPSAVRPPPSSFSLLSTKNELFLSYLQNLTFLIILSLRTFSSAHSDGRISEAANRQTVGKSAAVGEKERSYHHSSEKDLRDAVVEKLVDLRVYLEKGVRPLEGRLKYQLDKLLLAAADHARENANHSHHHHSTSRNQTADSSADDHEDEDEPNPLPISSIPPLAHRPNPSALIRPYSSSSTNHAHPAKPTSTSTKTTAPYRPPRINPTLPPPTDSTSTSTSKRAPRRFHAIDAFIREEMGDAPVPEMSIGAGASHSRGRSAANESSSKEAQKERERKEWEETRLVRLPSEKKKKRRRDGGGGGEAEDIIAGMNWGSIMNDDGDRRGGDREGRERERKRQKTKKTTSKKGTSMKGGRSRGRK